MIQKIRFGSSLAFLILAAITGLVGFFIVYHYASFERPIQRFAIVIDAGSTQTRSSLYSISLSPSGLEEAGAKIPVSDLVQVRELAECVNGGPLAAVSSPDVADRMLATCLPKFASKIKRLDFDADQGDQLDESDDDDEEVSQHQNKEEFDRQMALLNHRVNSVTHIHLGATAGMRALQLLDPSRAEEIIHWIRGSIWQTNSNLLAGTIFINPGYVGIIEGISEASFGWLSANFACDKLLIDANPSHHEAPLDSIGTLELGGASAQMAFQVSGSESPETLNGNGSMQASSLELFSENYHLATRSDLCLGMSQAILRANYILLRERFDQVSSVEQPLMEIENPCLQNGSRTSLHSGIVDGILTGACLEVSPNQRAQDEKFKQFLSSSRLWQKQEQAKLQIIGTGDVDRCEQLLTRLIEPQECRKLFSLCPSGKNKQQPPVGMPFVTISGYNKALQVLNLSPKKLHTEPAGSVHLRSKVIEEKLGGYPIDYTELEHKTRSFCSLDVAEFPARFPKMNKHFYNVNCLQMIYIRKLLREFYQFKPETATWSQIKFLLFPIGAQQQLDTTDNLKKKKENIDIGWTLGLLLNATSWELSSKTNMDDGPNNFIISHHGASIQFIIRTTVFLMFACVFIAGSIVVFSLVLAKRKYRSAYECHPAEVCPQNSL